MRRISILAALLLPLAGCYVPPDGDGAYGYAQPYGPGDYSGYQYNDGSPYMNYEGAEVPLIFYGGDWGFYDRDRRFHRAPDDVRRHLEERNPRGYDARPFGGRPPMTGGGYQQPPPPPQYRPNPVAPAFTAPYARPAPPPFRPAAPPPARFAPPPPRPVAPTARPPERHEERHGRDCPPGQPRC